MSDAIDTIVRAVLIGAGATIVLDLWSRFASLTLGFAPPNWRLVGRWLAYMPQGIFVQRNLAAARPLHGELLVGWAAHYAIGIAYAAVLLAIWGADWARRPTLLPALIVSTVALLAPFFIMQPGMGAGIAASRTPNPTAARIRSVAAHTMFGIGLFVSAWVLARLLP